MKLYIQSDLALIVNMAINKFQNESGVDALICKSKIDVLDFMFLSFLVLVVSVSCVITDL